MTPVRVEIPEHTDHARPPVEVVDDKRGTWGMALFILTEAFLFIMLFWAYYFDRNSAGRWSVEVPPKLHYSLPMLAILLTSSGVLFWGEQQVKKLHHGAARIALIGTMALGVAFLVLNVFEDMEHMLTLTPTTDSYGSLFYTITTLHAAHVTLGLCMLGYVLVLPKWEPVTYSPTRPYHNVALYWHFVDVVWVFIIALLYVWPNIYTYA